MTKYRQWIFQDRWAMVLPVVLMLGVLVSTLTYLVVGMTPVSAWATFVVVVCFVAWILRQVSSDPNVVQWWPQDRSATERIVIAVVLDALVIVTLWAQRGAYAMQTPWVGVHAWIFLFVGISSVLLISAIHPKNILSWLAVWLHCVVYWGVALVVFRFGYGYDTIIHQAAEKYVVAHGWISPLQPFYIGQYAFVAMVHIVSRIPVEWIDRALVPAMAILTLPLVGTYGLVRGYGLSAQSAFRSIIFLGLVPLTFFIFTVPHNLTILIATWVAFLLPMGATNRWWAAILGGMALAAVAIHPLIGVPLILLVIATVVFTRAKRYRAWIGITLALSIPVAHIAMFALYRHLQGLSWVETWRFWEHGDEMLLLFQQPYSFEGVPWSWSVFYTIAHYGITIGPIVLGFIVAWRMRRNNSMVLLGAMAVGLMMSSAMLVVMIHLPGIVQYEQWEFALRIRGSVIVFLLPALLVGLSRLFETGVTRRVVGVVVALLIPFVWYLTYPQVNPVVMSTGWNVAGHDMVAVRAIQHDANGVHYVVLADQILSAVALRELGFGLNVAPAGGSVVYPYPISPSEYLFPYREQLLYGQVSQDDILHIMNSLDVQRVYVAVHEYWFRVNAIQQEAIQLGARNVPSEYGVRVFVFEKK